MLNWDSLSDNKNQPSKVTPDQKAELPTDSNNQPDAPINASAQRTQGTEVPDASASLEPVRVEDKRVINGLSDVNQLAPFKYPWAWDFFLNANKNHWTPQDISITQDIYDFKHNLNDNERHVYTSILAYVATSDIIAMRNIGLAVMEKMTAPELQIYQARQMYEASLHSWTYQHCIETLGLDQSEIYNRYRVVPAINKKIQMTNRHLNSILRTDIDFNDPAELENFVMSYLFFAAIFEGIWLYHAFSPVFSIQRRGLMEGTSKQMQHIMRDVFMHTNFGVRVVSQIIMENNLKLDVNAINQMWTEAEECELAYARHLLETPLEGYTAEEHMQQYRYIANRRAQQLGLEQPYPNAICALPWLDDQPNISNEQDFFETQTGHNQTGGGLSWD